jgi:hypothetical protein
MSKRLLSNLVVTSLAAVFLLAAGCGAYNPNGTGGGGTGTPIPANGFYSLAIENSPSTLQALILPDDTFYGMFVTSSVNSLSVNGMATGKGLSGNDTYSGTFTEFPSNNATPFTDTISNTTDVPGTSMSGNLTRSSLQAGFGGTAPGTSFYVFGTPASLTPITTSPWVGSLLDGSPVTISISSAGVISTTSGGCTVSGTITPNSTDNYYTLTNVGFGGSCSTGLANKTASGVGIYYLLPNGTTQQLFLPIIVNNSVATIFYASK